VTPTYDVAVVGAGVSGLAAGFRLRRSGLRPRLFEASTVPGGRTFTLRRDGFIIDQGAGILSTNYRHLLGLVADADLSHLLQPAGDVFGFARADGGISTFGGGRWRQLTDAVRFPLSPRSKVTASRLLQDVARHRGSLIRQDLALACRLDRETASGYARRRLNEELLHALVDPTVRGLAGTSADDVSAFDFLVALSKFIGADALAFRGGMLSYAEALAAELDVEYGARVTTVRQAGRKVELEWTDQHGQAHGEVFAGCVLALPAPAIPSMHPGLDGERAAFLSSVRYTRSVGVHVALDAPPPGLTASCVIFPETVEPGVMTVVVEHLKAPDRAPHGRGLISLVTDDIRARELTHLGDDEIADRVLSAVDRFLLTVRRDLLFFEISRWNDVVLRARPGHYQRLRRFVEASARDDTRIQLAGDYLGVASLDTATAGGERAAATLIRACATVCDHV
jgi:oxygen-dependent protoporphyrinogen oxidase